MRKNGKQKKVFICAMLFLTVFTFAVTAGGDQETASEKKTEGFKVGLSNSYIGNNWRTQMIDGFKEMAEEYKSTLHPGAELRGMRLS